MDAQEFTKTHFCHFPGCEEEVKGTRGLGAYCPDHRGKAKAVQGVDPEPIGYEAKARELLAAGKALDKAKTDAAKAVEDLRAAGDRWRAAKLAIAEDES